MLRSKTTLNAIKVFACGAQGAEVFVAKERVRAMDKRDNEGVSGFDV